MIKAVIFDMDGVLIDSVDAGLRVRKKILARYNVDLDTVPDPQNENHRAASLRSLLANVQKHLGVVIDHDEFANQSIEYMREVFRKNGTTADLNLISFLEELRRHAIICVIASSSLRKAIDTKLDALGIRDYFSIIITGDDVKNHKPHPETYLQALANLSLPSEECIIFEDSLTGVRAAQAAGCRVIGFAQYNPSKLPLPGVLTVIKNWSEMNYDKLMHLSDTVS